MAEAANIEHGSKEEAWVEQLLDAQADLQTAIGLYRLQHGKDDRIEDRLARSLARQHKLLSEMGKPMYQPATHPDVDAPA